MRRLTALVLCCVLLVAFVFGVLASQAQAQKVYHDCDVAGQPGFWVLCCAAEDPGCLCAYEECFFLLL